MFNNNIYDIFLVRNTICYPWLVYTIQTLEIIDLQIHVAYRVGPELTLHDIVIDFKSMHALAVATCAWPSCMHEGLNFIIIVESDIHSCVQTQN